MKNEHRIIWVLIIIVILLFSNTFSTLLANEKNLYKHPSGCPTDSLGNIIHDEISDEKLGNIIINSDINSRIILPCTNLMGRDLTGLKGHWSNFEGSNLENSKLISSSLKYSNFSYAKLRGSDFRRSDLEGSIFSHSQLQDAVFIHANLERSIFAESELNGSNFSGSVLLLANFDKSNITSSNMKNADLSHSSLKYSNLYSTELSHSNLSNANFTSSDLRDVNITNTIMKNVILRNSLWGTKGSPQLDSLFDLVGADTIKYCGRANSSLTRLRDELKEIGMRHHEREITFVIEKNLTRYLLRYIDTDYQKKCYSVAPLPPYTIGDTFEGAFRYLFLEFPIGYGLYTGRPWKLIGTLILIGTLLNTIAILFPTKSGRIVKILPVDRLSHRGNNDWHIAKNSPVLTLNYQNMKSVIIGFYFSVLSTFHFGWRDFNVSNWLTKVQSSEFALRAHGWVRVVSGVQALLSLYFLSIWLLFYFGRPLQ